VTTVATPLVIRLATHLGVIDAIDEERRVHTVPTPRIGGLAVFFGFSVALFVVLGIALSSPKDALSVAPRIKRLAAASGDDDQFEARTAWSACSSRHADLGVGRLDDVMGMRAPQQVSPRRSSWRSPRSVRLRHSRHQNPFDTIRERIGSTFLFGWAVPLTLVWYVGMMNAINFIDGLDGLLAGVASISSLFLFVIAVTHGIPSSPWSVISLAGATLGFLRFNFDPAKIFLGDAGRCSSDTSSRRFPF